MIVVVSPEHADTVLAALNAQGEKTVRLGTMIARTDSGVVYQGALAL